MCSVLFFVSCIIITIVVVVKEGRSSKLPEESYPQMNIGNARPGLYECRATAPPMDDDNHLDIEELKRKLEETESAMTKIIARMSQIVPKTQVSFIIYPFTALILSISHPLAGHRPASPCPFCVPPNVIWLWCFII